MKNRAIAIALVLLVCLSLVACGGSSGESSGGAKATSNGGFAESDSLLVVFSFCYDNNENVVVQNVSDKPILDFSVTYLTFDKAGLPVEASWYYGEGSRYQNTGDVTSANLLPGEKGIYSFYGSSNAVYIVATASKITFAGGDVWEQKKLDAWETSVVKEFTPEKYNESIAALKPSAELAENCEFIKLESSLSDGSRGQSVIDFLLENTGSLGVTDVGYWFLEYDKNGYPLYVSPWDNYAKNAYFSNESINLAPGQSDTLSRRTEQDNCGNYKVIVKDIKFVNGNTWENPYQYEWILYNAAGYDGRPSPQLAAAVTPAPTMMPAPEPTAPPTPTPAPMTEGDLVTVLSEQPLIVKSTKYVVQDTRYKSLYPDMLQAVLQNNSEDDILSAVVGFVAWDENNLPLKIKGRYDSSGSYVIQANFSDMNLVPSASFGEGKGMSIDDSMPSIKTFKAVVVSYETFDGATWSNPYYDAFCELYEGKRLAATVSQ